MASNEQDEIDRRIAALESVTKRIAPGEDRLGAPAGEPVPGSVWNTRDRPVFPEDLPPSLESEFPVPVVILEAPEETVEGQRVLTVIPMMLETEMATERDLKLDRSILGYPAAAMTSAPVQMLEANLRDCVGVLPEEMIDAFETFASAEESGTAPRSDSLPAGVEAGTPYLFEGDPKWEFQAGIVAKLAYLQEPVAAWLETCGVLEWEPAPEFETSAAAAKWQDAVFELIRGGLEALRAIPALTPVHAAERDGRWSSIIVVEKPGGISDPAEFAEWPVYLAVVDEGPSKDQDTENLAYVRWRVPDDLQRIGGGERFFVWDRRGERFYGEGQVTPDGAFAILTEGNWSDFADLPDRMETLLLIVIVGEIEPDA